MKKHFFVLILLSTLSVHAVERVSLEQLQADWSKYENRMVQLTTPLVVCGSFYDSLILAPARIYCPEEKNDSAHIESVCVHCRNNYYRVRTGDRVKGFTARVTGERQLLTGKSITTHHEPKDRLPRPKKGVLRVVGANIENYFADLGGYAHPRTTAAQQSLKTRKLVRAMRAMHADIFACCEMQVGNKAPEMLLDELNKKGPEYAYVTMPMPDMDRIGGCFIYNTKRVRPYKQPLSAYGDTADHYHARMFAQAFETLDKHGNATGERFIISLNHLKSKRPGRTNYDTNQRRMENTDSLLFMLPDAVLRYDDTDILLLGDYNCYTLEEPIQAIVEAGYADQLMRYCPDGYSYCYKGEIGYLDRCFASPSMVPQIVQVRPWHVNADWYYQHGAYRMKDKSLHRYADHDPIIVDLVLKR